MGQILSILWEICYLKARSTTSEMPKISRENTLVRNVSLVVISTAEKKFAKTQAFDWLRFAISQRSRNDMNSTIPGEEKYFAEKH